MKGIISMCGTFILLFFVCLTAVAQIQLEAQIIDGNTKSPLMGAYISTDENNATLSNAEGSFSILVQSDETLLHISYLGYEEVTLNAKVLPKVIKLQPIAYDIKPVFVLGADKKQFISNLYEKYKQLAKSVKRKNCNYFYRQTIQDQGKCSEIIEAIFNMDSEFGLKNTKIVKGRYAVLPSDSSNVYTTFTNFYYYLQLRYFNKNKTKKNQLIAPLSDVSLDYYDVDIDLMFNNNGNDMYVAHFVPKKQYYRLLIKGDLYIDPLTLRVFRYDAYLPVPYTNLDRTQKGETVAHLIFDIDIAEEFPKINSIVASMEYSFAPKDDLVINANLSALLVKLENKNTIKGGKKLTGHNILLDEVYNLEDDAEFWRNNQIIKRTPLEESTLKLFEEKNLIGNYEINQP